MVVVYTPLEAASNHGRPRSLLWPPLTRVPPLRWDTSLQVLVMLLLPLPLPDPDPDPDRAWA